MGKAPVPDLVPAVPEDHPHMCGESRMMSHKTQRQLGSPPHVWGKLERPVVPVRACRITPTCVGKAYAPFLWLDPEEDHPHMCGESLVISGRNSVNLGSPPHVWGKRESTLTSLSCSRITPTCVGKALKDPSIGAIFKLQEHVF